MASGKQAWLPLFFWGGGETSTSSSVAPLKLEGSVGRAPASSTMKTLLKNVLSVCAFAWLVVAIFPPSSRRSSMRVRVRSLVFAYFQKVTEGHLLFSVTCVISPFGASCEPAGLAFADKACVVQTESCC